MQNLSETLAVWTTDHYNYLIKIRDEQTSHFIIEILPEADETLYHNKQFFIDSPEYKNILIEVHKKGITPLKQDFELKGAL
jgi:hypothetical protein